MRAVEQVPDAEAELVAWAQAHLPAKDAPVLAAAVASRADALVTGDRRHFGGFYGRTLEGVAVLGLREALERVLDAAL
jgi:predicted nucleic acid-binding protein